VIDELHVLRLEIISIPMNLKVLPHYFLFLASAFPIELKELFFKQEPILVLVVVFEEELNSVVIDSHVGIIGRVPDELHTVIRGHDPIHREGIEPRLKDEPSFRDQLLLLANQVHFGHKDDRLPGGSDQLPMLDGQLRDRLDMIPIPQLLLFVVSPVQLQLQRRNLQLLTHKLLELPECQT